MANVYVQALVDGYLSGLTERLDNFPGFPEGVSGTARRSVQAMWVFVTSPAPSAPTASSDGC